MAMNLCGNFYNSASSFTYAKSPLLKVVAPYFDQLYALDPEKAGGCAMGFTTGA
jgi:hypothetical protein